MGEKEGEGEGRRMEDRKEGMLYHSPFGVCVVMCREEQDREHAAEITRQLEEDERKLKERLGKEREGGREGGEEGNHDKCYLYQTP